AEAVAVANETARVFADDIKEKNDAAAKIAQETAQRELQIQEELVSQLKLKVQALRKKEGFSETLFTDEEEASLQKLQMEQLKKDLLSAEQEMLAMQERLKNLTELKDKSLEEFATAIKDPFLDSILEQIRQHEKQLNEITPSLRADHIEVKKIQAALDKLNGKLASAVEGLLKGTQAQYIVAKSKLDALDEWICKASLSSSAKSPELQQAQAEYETQQAALATLKAKSITTRPALPDCSVRIREFAVAHPSEFEMACQAVRPEPIKELHHATARISVQKQEEPIKGETPGMKPFSPLAIERAMIA
ncbi:MAG TPA: hypothetical protein PKI68_08435, partial [Pontiellaceae bacterium]|nr:hypothetical protein [Pontiellaceae bacterium]